MVVRALLDTGSLQSLLFGQASQNTKDDGNTSVETDTHQRVADALTDIFEVHGGTFEKHADGNDGIERLPLGWLGSGWSGCG